MRRPELLNSTCLVHEVEPCNAIGELVLGHRCAARILASQPSFARQEGKTLDLGSYTGRPPAMKTWAC